MKAIKILTLFLFTIANLVNAKSLDYRVETGVFTTSAGTIPNGCFGQLMTELNGDNSVASVFIERPRYRGCMNANYSYPGGDESLISYDIVKALDNDIWHIRVCQLVDGSMGSSCNNIVIKFVNREYLSPKGGKFVLAIDKLGEW